MENINPGDLVVVTWSDGYAVECKYVTTKSGFHIFEDKLPVDPEVNLICEEFKFNSTTAALNGGEDYELLFTIAQKDFDKIKFWKLGTREPIRDGIPLVVQLGYT